jgi:hypothetical protein
MLMSAKKQRREERAVPRLPGEGETVTVDYLRSISDDDGEAQLRDPMLWAYMLRDPTGAVSSHGHGKTRKECEDRAIAHAAECAEEAWPARRMWLPSKWRLLIWSPENSEKSGSPILLKSPLAKANLKKAKPRSLSKPQINALLVGIDLKLTRSSMGWSPDDGVTCFDGCFSPATISSLWERGLLDANFIDLRVIYGGRELTDMKNFDGAHYADLPGMPKFQVWTSALGKKVLQDKGLLTDQLAELVYH